MKPYYEEDNGNIQIYCGDCLDILPSFADKSVDLVLTDPPYLVTARGSAGNSGGMLQKEINRKGKVFEHNDCNINLYIQSLYNILKEGSHFYIMTNHINLIELLNTPTKTGFYFIKSLIWNKGNKIMGQYYMNQFEYILFFRKGFGKKINNCGTSDILNIPNVKTKNYNSVNLHDTEKPTRLMSVLIENSSNKNDLILDPFLGSGTTAVATKELGRKCIGIEISKEYCDIAIKRLKNTQKDMFL